MFGIGKKNKKQGLDGDLDTITEKFTEPYLHKRRVALYTDENTYMASSPFALNAGGHLHALLVLCCVMG
jgi:hypothetical protein